MTADSRQPMRVVMFSGQYLDPPALRFAVALEAHPAIELVAVLCQAAGAGWRYRLRERWRRRGLLAPLVAIREWLGAAATALRSPREARVRRAMCRRLAPRLLTVPDLHAPEVLARVQQWQPDLGVVYGAPILRPALFDVPPLGTYGIHHGRVPHYRGRKTTFWEIYNGESVAGVTIQRINAGVDTGDVIKSGEVPIGSKGYGRVERETQELGLRLFVEAVVEARSAAAAGVAQAERATRHYGQPNAADFIRLWLRVLRRRLGLRPP